MRAFIAIELSQPWQTLISEIQRKVRTATSIRWVKPHQAHLTLKFLGDITSEQLTSIQQKLNTISAASPCFCLQTQNLGAFPSLERPQVIWLGLKENQILLKLANNIEQAMCDLKFPRENRDFQSHITLGRLKANFNLKDFLRECPIKEISQQIEHISLFKSTLTVQGPIHELLSHFPLQSFKNRYNNDL